MEVEAGKIVDEWRIEEQAIETIEYAAMAGQEVGSVFRAGAAFEAGIPTELFRGRSDAYAISPDGGRFLMASPPPDACCVFRNRL